MKSKRLSYKKFINIVLIVSALVYLLYRLLTFDSYSSFFVHFQSSSAIDYCILLFALFLFPVNILLESVKWKYLLRDVETLSMKEAQRQVYYGCVGAFVTPNRLGEFPARALLLHNDNKFAESVTLGFVGSFALVCTIETIGISSVVYFFLHYLTGFSKRIVVLSVYILLVFCLILCLVYFPRIQLLFQNRMNGKTKRVFDAITNLGRSRFFHVCILSLLRYLVFSFQLYCVLYFCGVHLSLVQAMVSIPAYYALVSLMPSIPIADTIFRGSWAIAVFSFFTPNVAAVATAIILLWIINTVFPMLTGMLVKIHGIYRVG